MALTKEQRAANLARGRQTAIDNRRKRAAEKKAPNAPASQPVTAPAAPDAIGDDQALFDVEDAPEGMFNGQDSDSALAKVFKKLGLKGEVHDKEPRALPSAKLTKAQQSMYDSFAPLAIQGFVVVVGWSWGLLGEDYRVLAPSEEVAEKIIAPLMRIYARTSKIAASLNPNHTDAAASLAALIGYVWSSYGMYKQIKQEKQEYADENTVSERFTAIRPSHAPESRDDGEDARRNAAEAGNANGRAAPRRNGNQEHGVDLSKLTESERRAYEELSRLRDLDFASRARRSGHA